MATAGTLGISIQRTPYSESSQVVQFLTRDQGKVTCMVKGAFRVKNNYQGSLDLMTLSRLEFSRQRGRSLALLRSRRLRSHFPSVHSALNPFACAALMAELLRRGTEEAQRIPGLFELTLHSLEALEKGEGSPAVIAFVFQGLLLKKLGYEPVLDRCAECHAVPAAGSLLTVLPGRGGVVCKRCRSREDGGHTLSWKASGLILQCINGGPAPSDLPELTARILGEVWTFYERFFQYFLEKKINAYAFIKHLDWRS